MKLDLAEDVLKRYELLLNSAAGLETAALYLERTRIESEKRRNHQKRGATRLRKPSLRLLLETHRYSITSDPRDKIYAFLGLAGHKLKPWTTHPKAIVPDYGMSATDLYIHTTRVLMESYRSMSLLSHVQQRSDTYVEDLPSWVVDWSVALQPAPLRFRGSCNWCANASLEWTSRTDKDKRWLTVQGTRIDSVDALVTPTPASTGYWEDVLELVKGLPELYDFQPAQGHCLDGLKFLITGIQPGTGRNDLEHLVREYGGTLNSRPSSFVDFVISGQQPGWRKMRQSEELSLRSIDEDGLKRLIVERQLAQVRAMTSQASENISTIPRIDVLWRTLIADTFLKQHPAPAGCAKLFTSYLSEQVAKSAAWTELLEFGRADASETDVDASTIAHNQIKSEMEAASSGRRLFRTRQNMLGLGPLSLQAGDEVCILASGQVPHVLRKQNNGHYVLVGEAYVHGFMHGEAFATHERKIEDLVLE